MNTLDLNKSISESKTLSNFLTMFNKVLMGQTKSKSNHTGNKSVSWFNDSTIGLSKDRSNVMLSLTRKGEIPRQVELYELFADAASWVKELLLEMKELEQNSVGPIRKELRISESAVRQLNGQVQKLRDEKKELTKVNKFNLDDLADEVSNVKRLSKSLGMWRRISVSLMVVTIGTVSYVMLTKNIEGLVSLI